jgi:hypothetical protein
MSARLVNQQEIRDLMAITPNLPENDLILQQLDALAQELSVVKEVFTFTNAISAAAGANGIAAGVTSAPVATQIDASAMFVITAQTYHANSLNATQTFAVGTTFPNCSVLILDTGTIKQWSDVAVPISSWFGVGANPFYIPEPRIIAANSQIVCTYVNFDAAAGFNIRLAFHGYKLYSLNRGALPGR